MTPTVDPMVRADGRCVVCGGERVLTAQARRYAGAHLDADPFCSTDCCRRYHGAPRSPLLSEARARAARDSAQRFRSEYSASPA